MKPYLTFSIIGGGEYIEGTLIVTFPPVVEVRSAGVPAEVKVEGIGELVTSSLRCGDRLCLLLA